MSIIITVDVSIEAIYFYNRYKLLGTLLIAAVCAVEIIFQVTVKDFCDIDDVQGI